MPARIPCEFYLLRYVPDAVKNEFVNIGVLLREAGRTETTRVRFTRDWGRVRCMDPDADTALLEAMEGELAVRIREGGSGSKPAMQMLEESLSTGVQMTEARGALAESIPAEMDQLMRLYVEPLREKVVRRKAGRAAIVASMRSEFERAGVWELLRKRIPAAQYTRPGDPLRLDCGYRMLAGTGLAPGRESGGESSRGSGRGSGRESGRESGRQASVRIFQAVSLDGDLEAAKVLSYAAGRLREGVERIEKATLDLAAIVEPLRSLARRAGSDDDPGSEAEDRYRFGIETMEEAQIRVLTVSDLSRIAETAKRELHV